jgi:hypothetical protein
MLHAAQAGNADVSEAVHATVATVEFRFGPAVLAHFGGRAAEQLEAQNSGGKLFQGACQLRHDHDHMAHARTFGHEPAHRLAG